VQCIIVGEEDLVHTGLRGMVEAREDGGGGGSRRGWRWKADRLALAVVVEMFWNSPVAFPLPPSSFLSPVRLVPTSVNEKVTV
jgi:hypothetical protein